jgi:16S rRNA (adenine(1408)-N(1))-methyltransferase
MRRVIGRTVAPLDEDELARWLDAAERVVLDVGCGSGRAVLETAAAEPCAAVIGLDADAAAMADASRRAARSAAGPAPRAGFPNARFVAGAAEELPGPFAGRAVEVTVRFPWGSLLEGAVGGGPVAAGLAASVRPGGRLTLLTGLVARDGLGSLQADVEDPGRLAARLAATYGSLGLIVETCRAATRDEIAASGSSWARRLRAADARRPVLAILVRPPAA